MERKHKFPYEKTNPKNVSSRVEAASKVVSFFRRHELLPSKLMIVMLMISL